MNIILIHPDEWPTPGETLGEIRLSDHRFDYIKRIHKPLIGDHLRIGLLNGDLGVAEVLELTQDFVRLNAKLCTKPPRPNPATLVLALPRPKVLRRTIQSAASLGIKDIYLINSYRVEKSYWQTPLLSENSIHEQLVLGLEQAQDTVLPRVHLKRRFKPFVEDELSDIVTNKLAIVAHPKDTQEPFPAQLNDACIIAIGPEGGFIPYEIALLESIGFQTKTLGPRILKVETAVAAILGRGLT